MRLKVPGAAGDCSRKREPVAGGVVTWCLGPRCESDLTAGLIDYQSPNYQGQRPWLLQQERDESWPQGRPSWPLVLLHLRLIVSRSRRVQG